MKYTLIALFSLIAIFHFTQIRDGQYLSDQVIFLSSLILAATLGALFLSIFRWKITLVYLIAYFSYFIIAPLVYYSTLIDKYLDPESLNTPFPLSFLGPDLDLEMFGIVLTIASLLVSVVFVVKLIEKRKYFLG